MIWVLKNLHVEFAFTCDKVSFWVENFPCFDFWQYAVQTEQTGHKRKWLSYFTKIRSRQSFNWFTEKSVRYSSHISSFTQKSIKYSKFIAQIWMPQCCRKNLGDGPGILYHIFSCHRWGWRLYSYSYSFSCYKIQKLT